MKTIDFGQKINNRLRLCLGYFDSLHLAHRGIINAAIADAEHYGGVSAALTYGDNFFGILGRKQGLVYTLGERIELLASISPDYCIVKSFDSDFMKLSPTEFFGLFADTYDIAAIYCGTDFRFGANALGDVSLLRGLCEDRDVKLTVIGDISLDGEKISSTRIRKLIADGAITQANVMLSDAYRIGGITVKGRGDGGRMGFATANFKLPPEKLCPRCGVYLTSAELDGRQYKSVTNVGSKPTFGDGNIGVETHLLDYAGGELYGRRLTVIFSDYLRDIKKFDTIDELKRQLNKDIAVRRAYD
ncbi:MAG: riboflavin biosynthesis protein RibF [Clostridiales bacterium]|jgi:riboflavin kinase/FMN adenylyltransferase|nr:riboflavin biosynthesis protein RibF [Clostridiales bacterium]